MVCDCFTKAEANAFNYWWLVSDTQDNAALIAMNTNWTACTATKSLYALGNYSRFVRPGWHRIGAIGKPASDLEVTAYKETATGQFAVVAINESDTAQDVDFKLAGFAPSMITPYRTSSEENLARLHDIGASPGGFRAILAARSVTTFTGAVLSPTRRRSLVNSESQEGRCP